MADKLVAVRIKQQDNTYSNEIPIGARAENVAYDNTKNLLQVLGTIDMYKGDVQTQLDALFEDFNGIAEDVAGAIDDWVTEHMPSWDPEEHLDDTLTADNLAPVSSAVPKLIAVNEAEIQGTKMKISTTGQEDLTVLTPSDIDDTLSQQGEAADAKATGEMIMINNAAAAGTRVRLITTNEDITFLIDDDIDTTLSVEGAVADAKATGDAISDSNAAALAAMAPAYNPSGTYAVGVYVNHNGAIYRCTTAITTAEAWTAGHWTEVPLGTDLADQVSDLKESLTSFTEFEYIPMQYGYVPSNLIVGDQIDLTDVRSSEQTKYAILDCAEGDVFTVNSIGTRSARSWVFVDTNSLVVSIATYEESTSGIYDLKITAPVGATKLLIHSRDNLLSYIGNPSTLNDVYSDINDTSNTLYDYMMGNPISIKQTGEITQAYINSRGVLKTGTRHFKSKIYNVLQNKTYKITTTGNRLIYGLYNSLEVDSRAVVFVNATAEISVDHYITNDNALYLMVYYWFDGDDSMDADVSLIIEDNTEEEEARKRHFNICIFGNSYAADAWGYVPFILKKYGITVNIYMYYRGSGSPSRLVQEWEDTGDTGYDIYGGGHIRRMIHIDTRTETQWSIPQTGYSAKNILEFVNDPARNVDKWDIITLQPVSSEQYSDGEGGWTMKPGLEPAFRQVINLINASYTDTYTLGFFETYNRFKTIGGVPVSALDDRVETMSANEASFKAEPFELLLPVGAAVFSARTNSLLASADISDMTNLWASDLTHLQEGVPCYLAALTVCQAIFNKYFPKYSVLNDDTRITSALLTNWNVQFKNGSPLEASELAYQLAQKCAVIANEHPFDITPIYLPTETTEIVYDRSKYWADSLIDTSIVPKT